MTNNPSFVGERKKIQNTLLEAYKEKYISEDQKFLNNIIAIFRDDARIEEILWSKIRLIEHDYNVFETKTKQIWPDVHPLSLKDYCSERGITDLKNIPPRFRGKFYSDICKYLNI